ncbi:phage head closure protein [Cytobacillus purgationiresistens]|uniref:SPP1 family predicted phage head-tail adaptor n=1 Tax=Cytobacillus purgationiresistens TaxID=863449 RepID=A0ABU0ACB2_9BACI|nr:phage head closure protein [Cytobacillus purgationiresistens]MDQ0268877.1 SPP1 family predicted phage head-tail adaptor [Cytobacillus purgationiresistens]
MSNPAKYRQRITFQKKVSMKDEEGNNVTDWQDQFTVWASIKGLRGRDYLIAGADAVKISTRIYIRFRLGITHDMRILFRDKETKRYFDITNSNNVEEKNIEIEILANEVGLNG